MEASTRPLRADPRPLYVRAEQSILGLIDALDLEPGARLPAELELARILGISRSTVREALRNLQLSGRVRRVHGLGTIVLPPIEIVAGLETLESLESLAQRQGWVCGTIDQTVEATTLSDVDAETLRRESGAVATRVARTKTRDGVRIAFMESVFPADVMGPDEFRAAFSTSIIDMFLERGEPVLHHARAHVRLGQADGEVATKLGLRSRPALLLIEEVFHNPTDAPFCMNRNWFMPGSVRLDLVRRPR